MASQASEDKKSAKGKIETLTVIEVVSSLVSSSGGGDLCSEGRGFTS